LQEADEGWLKCFNISMPRSIKNRNNLEKMLIFNYQNLVGSIRAAMVLKIIKDILAVHRGIFPNGNPI
jgi:hypothetical protein